MNIGNVEHNREHSAGGSKNKCCTGVVKGRN